MPLQRFVKFLHLSTLVYSIANSKNKTMKTIKILFAAIMLFSAATLFAQSSGKQKQPKQKNEKNTGDNNSGKFYTCTMHAKEFSKGPGKCTQCGMDLVLSENGKGKALGKDKQKDHSKFLCPMHPEVTSEQAGKCSKCGMDLVKNKKDKGGKEKKEKHSMYECPMHADVTSNQPGKCNKCGMDLKEKKHDKKHD